MHQVYTVKCHLITMTVTSRDDLLLVAVGVALKEALSPEFKVYQQQVIDNAKALCTALQNKGFTIVSGRPLPLSQVDIYHCLRWTFNTVVSGRLSSSWQIHVLVDCIPRDYCFFFILHFTICAC